MEEQVLCNWTVRAIRAIRAQLATRADWMGQGVFIRVKVGVKRVCGRELVVGNGGG